MAADLQASRQGAPGSGDPVAPDGTPQASGANPRPDAGDLPFDSFDDGFGDIRTTSQPDEDPELAAIRAEGLTPRQLRMARRISQVHNLPIESDLDAVRQLRKIGVDPFRRPTPVDMPGEATPDPEPVTGKAVVPAGKAGKQTLPSTEVRAEEIRIRDVQIIQRDIARRRRRKLALLMVRLLFFVGIPTLIGYYYYRDIASRLYATNSEFIIQMQAPQSASGAASALTSSPLATVQDSITVQGYLLSREAMLRLDADLGFHDHFSQPQIDQLQRLDPDASQEAIYKAFKRSIRIGYDPTEGVMRMEVSAADPETSVAWSKALISYAEELVDQMTARLREDQMKGARESYDEAEQKMLAAQRKVVDLQEELGIIDADSETGAVTSQILDYEAEIRKKELEMQAMLDNPNPNEARVEGVKSDIQRLNDAITALRSEITTSDASGESLARIRSELRLAELDLESRQNLMQQALELMEKARIEANRQVRYVKVFVAPIAPDVPTYPNVFSRTLLIFLIFSGLYLVMSLTASVLREQVSA